MPSFDQALSAVLSSPVGMYLLPAVALVGGAFLWAAGGRALKPLFVLASALGGAAVGAVHFAPMLAPHVGAVPPGYAGVALGGVAGLLLAVLLFRAAMGLATAVTVAGIAGLTAATILGVTPRPFTPGPADPVVREDRGGASSGHDAAEQAVVVYGRATTGTDEHDRALPRAAARRGGYAGPGKSAARETARPARSGHPAEVDRPAGKLADLTKLAESGRVADSVDLADAGDRDASTMIDASMLPPGLQGLPIDGVDLQSLGVLMPGQEAGASGIGGLDRAGLIAAARERATAAWASLPPRARHGLTVAVLAGAALGLLIGVVMPRRSAALVTAALGAGLMLLAGTVLIRGLDGADLPRRVLAVLEQRGPGAWLIAWGVLSVVGMAIQARHRPRPARSRPQANAA